MTERRPVAPLTCDEARDLAAGYVLEILDEEETARLRQHLSTCPDPHAEIDELGGITPYLAESLEPVDPPADLGRRIVAAISAEAAAARAERETAGAPSTPAPVQSPAGRPASVASLADERARRRSPLTWIAAIAAVLVIAALGAWNLGLRTELDSARNYDAAVNRLVELASAPGGQAAILRPQVAGGPAGIAAVGPDGRVEIALRGLAPTSGTEVYEAWLIGPENAPVAIGSLTPAPGGLGILRITGAPTGPGVTVALTREPSAGRTSPTPPILSLGVASGST